MVIKMKMEKGKINSIKSEEYKKGRLDIFDIESTESIHRNLIAFLSDLGFKNQSNLSKFDTDFSLFDGVIFAYEDNIRITLIWEDSKKLIVDSNKEKKEVVGLLENYFQIF